MSLIYFLSLLFSFSFFSINFDYIWAQNKWEFDTLFDYDSKIQSKDFGTFSECFIV